MISYYTISNVNVTTSKLICITIMARILQDTSQPMVPISITARQFITNITLMAPDFIPHSCNLDHSPIVVLYLQ